MYELLYKSYCCSAPLSIPPAPTGPGVADTPLRPGQSTLEGDGLCLKIPLFLAGSPEAGRPSTSVPGLLSWLPDVEAGSVWIQIKAYGFFFNRASNSLIFSRSSSVFLRSVMSLMVSMINFVRLASR